MTKLSGQMKLNSRDVASYVSTPHSAQEMKKPLLREAFPSPPIGEELWAVHRITTTPRKP